MQITDVRVRKITKEGKMKAVVSITLDDEFVVHDIKVIEGEKGMFIAMPSKPTANASFYNRMYIRNKFTWYCQWIIIVLQLIHINLHLILRFCHTKIQNPPPPCKHSARIIF